MFRIGEFSKISQVATSQLRYYDEIGLFAPSKTDEWTGYRYYSAKQLPQLNRILALKEIGMSLEQIRQILADEVSADQIRGMFKLKKAQIEQSLQAEIARLRHIESRLKQIDSDDLLQDIDVKIKSIPAQPFLSVRERVPSFQHARLIIGEMFQALPSAVDKNVLGDFTAILHCDEYKIKDIDLEMGFALSETVNVPVQLPSKRLVTLSHLPAVEAMATAVRIGFPDTSHNCRASLANWVETNGYEFDGQGREIFRVPPRPGREHETVLEIQYPIREMPRTAASTVSIS